jgi:voltage-gated potassium channel
MNERALRFERGFSIPMLVAALLVIPVVAVEQSRAGEPWRSTAAVLNWGIWIAFAVELVAMLAVVSDRWLWIRQHPLEVVVVHFTVPFLPASFQAARALRLLRLLRLLRVARFARRAFSLEGVRYAAILAGLTALGGGYAYSLAESAQDPAPSVWDGTWWAFSTMTTVGYGDQVPVTDTGRVLAMALMLVGIGFIAILTGAIAERFLAGQVQETQDEIREEVEAVESDVLAELQAITARLQALELRLSAPRSSGPG